MLLRPRLRPSIAALAALLALALANPLCCHFMPLFMAEQVQTETAFDGVDKLCAGKPAAVRVDDGLPALPVLVVARAAPAPVSRLSGEAPWRPTRPPEWGGPPRHILFGVYRV